MWHGPAAGLAYARVHTATVVGDDPIYMLTGSTPATGNVLATLLGVLERTGGYGLRTMCEAGGTASATIIGRLDT